MVFVFGVDIPLVEMIFVLTLMLVLLFGLIIYLIISQVKLHRMLKVVISKENIELRGLKDIGTGEKKELELLRFIRQELDKLIYGKIYGKKMEVLLKTKKVKKRAPKRKVTKKTVIKKKFIKKKKAGKKKKPGEEGWVPFEEVKEVRSYK